MKNFRTPLRTVLLAFLIAVAVGVVQHLIPFPGGLIELTTASGGLSILDQQPAFTSDEVHHRLEAFGPVARSLYQRFTVTTDILFPLTVLVFFLLLVGFTVDRLTLSPSLRAVLLALPFLWFSMDMVENLSIFRLLSEFPAQIDFLAANVGYVTLAKRLTLLATVVLLAVLWVMALLGRLPFREETVAAGRSVK